MIPSNEGDSELPVFAGRHMETALVPVHLDIQDVSRVKRQKLASQIQQDLAGLVFFQEDIKGIGDLVVLERLDQIENGRDIVACHRVGLRGRDENDIHANGLAAQLLGKKVAVLSAQIDVQENQVEGAPTFQPPQKGGGVGEILNLRGYIF